MFKFFSWVFCCPKQRTAATEPQREPEPTSEAREAPRPMGVPRRTKQDWQRCQDDYMDQYQERYRKKLRSNLKRTTSSSRSQSSSSTRASRPCHDKGMHDFFSSMERVNQLNNMVMQNLRYMRMLELSRNMAVANLYAQNVYAGKLYARNLHVYPEQPVVQGPELVTPNEPNTGKEQNIPPRPRSPMSPMSPMSPRSPLSQRNAKQRRTNPAQNKHKKHIASGDMDRFIQIMRGNVSPPSTTKTDTTFQTELDKCAALMGGFKQSTGTVSDTSEACDVKNCPLSSC